MKEITINEEDYAKAAAAAMNHMMDVLAEGDNEDKTKAMFKFALQFAVIQAEIHRYLFEEEGENYA